uniref:Uncharacterized protein n=1 Tax=Anguilla anguilla TaxID=7936 RepID=A0A0E9RJW4_ANGAN
MYNEGRRFFCSITKVMVPTSTALNS